MEFSRKEYWSGLPFPSPVDHILSELSIMTCPSWVALHVMGHSFLELDKAVVHVIRIWTVWNGIKIVHWKMNSPTQIGRCPICYWRSVEKQLQKEWRDNAKAKAHPVVDMTGDGSKVRCHKEQYCIGTWNVRSLTQGKLEVVKQKMARVNTDILGISELKWIRMGEFNLDDHYIYYYGQESLRRNGAAIIVNKRVWNAVPGCSLKNDKMISACFQGKPFNITVIQVHAPTTNAKETEVEWFYHDLQDLELTPKKRCPFHHRGLECESRKSRVKELNRQVWPWSTKWSREKANRVLPREHTCHSKHPRPTTQETTLHMDISRYKYQNQID